MGQIESKLGFEFIVWVMLLYDLYELDCPSMPLIDTLSVEEPRQLGNKSAVGATYFGSVSLNMSNIESNPSAENLPSVGLILGSVLGIWIPSISSGV